VVYDSPDGMFRGNHNCFSLTTSSFFVSSEKSG
jgi:hypothetical protein